MQFIRRRSSISVDFFLFGLLIFAAAILLALSFWLQVYDSELRKKKTLLTTEAVRIDAVLIDAMDYITQYTSFIGEKIAQHNDEQDLPYIANLFSSGSIARSQERSAYFTTTFDWVTPDRQLLVSNKIGVLPKPFDMSDRDYLQRTPQSPWKLQLSSPRIGGLSGQWIVPAGMGITDENGKFLGSITLGFSLNGLAHRIAQTVGETDVRYLVLDSDGKLILDSQGNSDGAPDPNFSLGVNALSAEKGGTGYLTQPLVRGTNEYSYAMKVDKYPYVVLTGYSQGMASTLFNQIVLSRGIGLFSIAIGAVAMLYLMQRRLIQPVLGLAHKADRIRRGEQVVAVDSPIQEIAMLDRALQKISSYIQNEHRINAELNYKTQQLELKTIELEEATEEAIAARDAAIKADQAKSEFLANMSHELRTPMNAVVGLTNILLMQNAPSPERQKEYLQTLQMSAQQLLQLINDLLDVAKLENDQVELERIPFDLRTVAGEVIALHKLRAQEKNIDLTLDVKSWPPVKLLGDPLRLRQILINLVSNAIKFTEHGGVTLKIECATRPGGDTDLSFSVIDTGIGIASDKLGSVFNKFSQADSSITRRYGGTGLGLSICKRLTELMQAELSVNSEVGKGTCFNLKLCLPATTERAENTAVNETPSPVDRSKNADFNILLVEDNHENILVVTTLLDTYGYSYSLAHNGKEALEKLATKNFDLVLMDIQMPEMDGFKTTRAIREKERRENGPSLPIIGMTAHALAGDRESYLAAGMNDSVAKPFDPQRFLQLLQYYSARPTERSSKVA